MYSVHYIQPNFLSHNKDVDDATMVRVDLERKIETLREELEYNRKVHNEEMEDLKEQIASQVPYLLTQKHCLHILRVSTSRLTVSRPI